MRRQARSISKPKNVGLVCSTLNIYSKFEYLFEFGQMQ